MEFEEIKKKSENFRREVHQQTTGYIMTALGIVAGLAWNEAIKAFIDYVYPAGGGNSLSAKFSYAVIVTIIIVIVSVYLVRLAGKKEE